MDIYQGRERHSTVEQTHRTVQRINEALGNKQYCSAAFLDISQASDKVWRNGLPYKLKLCKIKRFSRQRLGRMSSAMLRRVAFVRTDYRKNLAPSLSR
jgi:hypothetical protein